MDMSAYPDEKEVLLSDGVKLEVISIDQTMKNSKPHNVIVLKS